MGKSIKLFFIKSFFYKNKVHFFRSCLRRINIWVRELKIALLQEAGCGYQKKQIRLLEETNRENAHLKKKKLIEEKSPKQPKDF